ncbi:MAG: M23 family metallopeptidase [Treponema sp.]|nr:M23 family metallopeptidase [Treponema sp.]
MEVISFVGYSAPRFSLRAILKESSRRITGTARQRTGWHQHELQHLFQGAAVCAVRRMRAVFVRPWLFGVAVFVLFEIGAGFAVQTYMQNHTRPLSLHREGTTELNVLNNVMARFTLDDGAGFDERGDLIGGAPPAVPDTVFQQPVTFQTYTVRQGDTVSGITRRFHLTNLSTIIGVNGIDNARALAVGQQLRIPSVDGLLYTVVTGDTLDGIARRYDVSVEDVLDVNDLASPVLQVGQRLFIPGARLSSEQLQRVLGMRFVSPITARYRVSSPFGPRLDPITGTPSNHTGIDLACPQGTPVLAAMAGTVAYVGYSNVFGNYVIVNHGNGYQSLYGHLSQTAARRGQRVQQGTRLGSVGSTGYSTGPHLHFTLYKNGALVDPETLIRFR